jgi:hypothetical protein
MLPAAGYKMDGFHSVWRLDLARQLAARISAFPGVRAIVVGGSVARGYADEYSDLEMPILWETMPGDDTRQAIVAALRAEFLYGYDGPSLEDQLLVSGFQVDLWHNTVAAEEVVMDDVLCRYSTDLGDSNFMDTIRACTPLYGEEIIRRWKARAQDYPDELAMRAIREYLPAFQTSQVAITAQRANPTEFYAGLCRLQQAIFLVLLALNRAYFPTFKWMVRVLESLPLQPRDTAQRFRRAFEVPYAEAVAGTAQLLDETLVLVEQHFPQIDTAGARRRLAYVRAAYEKPVGLA